MGWNLFWLDDACSCALCVHGHLYCGASWLSGSVRDVDYKREVAGSIPGCAEYVSDVVLLGKGRCSHIHSLDPGVSGYTW